MHADRCEGAGVTVVSGMLPIIMSYSHPNAFFSLLHRGCTFRHRFNTQVYLILIPLIQLHLLLLFIAEHSFWILLKTLNKNSSIFTGDMKICIYTGLYWYKYEIKTSHAHSAHLTCASSRSSQHQQKGVSPRMLKALVSRGHPEFSSNRQQDAHEFLLHLVNLVEVSKAACLLTKGNDGLFLSYLVDTHTHKRVTFIHVIHSSANPDLNLHN